MPRRWPATARPNTRPTSRCGSRNRDCRHRHHRRLRRPAAVIFFAAIRRSTPCPRAIGFRRSTSATRKATRPIWRRRRRPMKNIAAMRWCAAANRKWSKAAPARATCLREFPDYATALACYRSDEYQRAKPLRLPHSQIDFLIVEGYDGPQPPRFGRAARGRGQQRLLDRPHRCDRCGGLQALHGGRSGAVRRVRRHAIWCAAASRKRQKANHAAAPWCWNFRATTPRSPAIARPAIRRQKSCATARREFDLVIVEGYDGPKF